MDKKLPTLHKIRRVFRKQKIEIRNHKRQCPNVLPRGDVGATYRKRIKNKLSRFSNLQI